MTTPRIPKSWNGVKIKGVKFTDNMGKFIGDTEKKAADAIHKALIQGAAEASVFTPIKTGTLINSRFNNVSKEGGKIVGTTGYTADYALAVHDPENPQQFRRESAEKEFLKKGFDAARPLIDKIITGAIKT